MSSLSAKYGTYPFSFFKKSPRSPVIVSSSTGLSFSSTAPSSSSGSIYPIKSVLYLRSSPFPSHNWSLPICLVNLDLVTLPAFLSLSLMFKRVFKVFHSFMLSLKLSILSFSFKSIVVSNPYSVFPNGNFAPFESSGISFCIGSSSPSSTGLNGKLKSPATITLRFAFLLMFITSFSALISFIFFPKSVTFPSFSVLPLSRLVVLFKCNAIKSKTCSLESLSNDITSIVSFSVSPPLANLTFLITSPYCVSCSS